MVSHLRRASFVQRETIIRALANGDDYARALLREQLEREELSERLDLTPGAE